MAGNWKWYIVYWSVRSSPYVVDVATSKKEAIRLATKYAIEGEWPVRPAEVARELEKYEELDIMGEFGLFLIKARNSKEALAKARKLVSYKMDVW